MANNHNHNRISILIVDDHEVVRNGIRAYLETVKEFQVVGEAASGEEAHQAGLGPYPRYCAAGL